MKRAFTLVELLVVIAIIIVLAAILFPTYRSVREGARKTQCIANLKQIGTALTLYLADYDQTYPLGAYHSEGKYPDWDVSWHQTLAVYTRSWGPFVCPSTPKGIGIRDSYGSNRFVSGFRFGIKDAQIPIPADIIYAAEKLNPDFCFFVPGEVHPNWKPLDPRHNLRLQVLCCDGHVEAVRPTDLQIAHVQ